MFYVSTQIAGQDHLALCGDRIGKVASQQRTQRHPLRVALDGVNKLQKVEHAFAVAAAIFTDGKLGKVSLAFSVIETPRASVLGHVGDGALADLYGGARRGAQFQPLHRLAVGQTKEARAHVVDAEPPSYAVLTCQACELGDVVRGIPCASIKTCAAAGIAHCMIHGPSGEAHIPCMLEDAGAEGWP